MIADAKEALDYYGETLDIRRPGIELHVEIQRVRLIYEGGKLKPRELDMTEAIRITEQNVPRVEVLFQ